MATINTLIFLPRTGRSTVPKEEKMTETSSRVQERKKTHKKTQKNTHTNVGRTTDEQTGRQVGWTDSITTTITAQQPMFGDVRRASNQPVRLGRPYQSTAPRTGSPPRFRDSEDLGSFLRRHSPDAWFTIQHTSYYLTTTYKTRQHTHSQGP